MWLMIRVKVILDNPQTSPANRRFEWFASVDHLSNCGKPALLITSKNQDSSSCLFLSDTILILYLLRTIFHVLSTSSLHIICLLTFGLPLHWSDSKVKKLTLFDLFFSLSSLSLFPYSLHWHTRKTTTNWIQIHTKNLNHILTPLSSQKGMFVSNNKKSNHS